MAKRKAHAPARRPRRRRRSSPMSEPGTRRRRRTTGTRRRRRAGSSKRGLSEIFSGNSFMEAGKANLSGLAGGGISYFIDKMGLADANSLVRGLVHLGGAMVVSGGFKYHNIAAGMSGGYGYTLMSELSGGLSEMEDTEYVDQDELSEYPDALDENNNPLFLAEDGELYYLEEYELADDGGMYLADGTGMARMYPDYVQNP